MLSDIEILDSIKKKEISIKPYNKKAVGQSCYNVTLADNILILQEKQTIDTKKDISPKYKDIKIDEKGYTIRPKEFILASTIETISTHRDIGVFLDGTSTLARLGISIHQTSTSIKPGQDPHTTTLEVFNSGTCNIILHKGMKIGKYIFFKSKKKNSKNYLSEYGKQKKAKGAKLSNLKIGI